MGKREKWRSEGMRKQRRRSGKGTNSKRRKRHRRRKRRNEGKEVKREKLRSEGMRKQNVCVMMSMSTLIWDEISQGVFLFGKISR